MSGPSAEPWSARFLERVESFDTGPSAQAALDARAQLPVEDLRIGPGSVRARVPDSAGGGYEVWIELPVFDRVRWTRAEQALAADPEAREQLFDGEFPERLDGLLARAGLSLLPARPRDLAAECSCPLWSPTCRHLAAVLGALAAAFDEDPFRLTAWRGRDRERLLRHIREAHAARAASEPNAAGAADASSRPLTDCLEDFWQEGDRHRRLLAASGSGSGSDSGSDSRPGSAPAAEGATALAALAPSGIVVRGRSLESLLAPAYRALQED
ncbi:hypothetical protein GXW83_15905 [Streptacidiphilus sp. PB12-B1b]|uniref:SWIM zinc finger family protein n=1 Tax=Streptacidiphilus sp. PB12-B1b TaxID=2705012 RepID=UPI0015FAC23F|nr:SWIM zinc finger family protein [Streptacidiphilus sp. PB12-B1b]QMU76971.1 hypothetical protein GXW83_15905 [Streptacidiphilus sp. PB12-B1b]